ncbi:MAG: zinc-ribbon domain-containing protein [Gemmatimonadaceae bacterium]
MNVSCPQCSTVYRVDPAKVPQGGVRARCSACGGVIPVGMIAEQHQPAAPVRPRTPTPPRPATLPPLRPTPRAPWPSVATPSSPAPAQQPPSVSPFLPSPYASSPAPAPAQPLGSAPASQAPVSVPRYTPPAPGERRPINPFLARDPSLRAKRLARALVSDMVAYYPAKHSEGLQRGTLKELFREEIKKSYEEYVTQVGSDFARSTTHFQEALNEVLGAGKRIF